MAGENIVVGVRQDAGIQATVASASTRSGRDLVAASLAQPIQVAELQTVQLAWGYRRGRDQDRDGIPDRYDRDRDGDGIPNRRDPNPNRPNFPFPYPRPMPPRFDRPCYPRERPDFFINGWPRCYR